MFNIKFKSLASSSAGNAYLLEGYKTKILIECGLTFRKLLDKLDGKFSDIDACIVTHEHGDHCKCHVDIADMGIPVHGILETFKGVYHRNFVHHSVYSKIEDRVPPVIYKSFTIGEFIIKPLWADHGETPLCAYLIQSELSGEKLIFLIDTFYCPYKLKNITHYVIEANYSEKLLKENQDGNKVYVDRLWGSHFSIERVCNFFQSQKENGNLGRNAKIWLTHLSSTNADGEIFKTIIKNVTGIEPVICEK